jgi:cysteine desulfurase
MVYLDNAATTPATPEVAAAVAAALTRTYANPSSLHGWGVAAAGLIAGAREAVAALLGCAAAEVVFTSGGTEGNNQAVLGAARARRREGDHCVTTMSEHSSVLAAFAQLEAEGFRVTYLRPDGAGRVSPEQVAAALTPGTVLVSVHHVNNEVGAVQPVEAIGRLPRGRAAFHVDAVQSFGKLPLRVRDWGIDLCTVSAHKIHGPKGVGALYVRRGTRLRPLHVGGEQEGGLRAGTENVPGIAGFGAAALAAREDPGAERMRALKVRLARGLLAGVPGARVNGPDPGDPTAGAPHILNVSFPGARGETLLHALEGEGVAVSTGSACHSRRSEPSHVLQALGVPPEARDSALRFSLSRLTTEAEVDAAVAAASRALPALRAAVARR